MVKESLFVDQVQVRRIPDTEKNQLVLEFRRSGMKMKEWCTIRGIGFSTFKRWLYQQKTGTPLVSTPQETAKSSSSSSSTAATTWTHMNIVSEDLSTDIVAVPSAIRIEVGGVLIHISSETPAVLLKTVLQEVMSI